MPLSSWKIGCLICSLVFIGACSSTAKVRHTTLNAPGGSNPEAASAVKAGNEAFAAGQWVAAKQHYEKAISIQETLAEAHYNLALTLDRLGEPLLAEAHYAEAAKLTLRQCRICRYRIPYLIPLSGVDSAWRFE